MTRHSFYPALIAVFALSVAASPASADRAPNVPDAIVDLSTPAGMQLLKSQWRYSDARIVEVEHHAAGADNRASGEAIRTHDIEPHAGGADFDDGKWPVIDPHSLETRRSSGRLAFSWYRIKITIPERVGAFETNGAVAVLEVVLDDYAEIWVDGQLPQVLGQVGGPLVAGWNAPNRLVIGRGVKPGRQIQLAVFAANGPLSDPPGNFVWIRSATLDFYKPQRWAPFPQVKLMVDRGDAGLDEIVPPDAVLERVADGFAFTEGPVWVPAATGGAGAVPVSSGYLLFSDPNRNVIYRWNPDGQVFIFRTKSGYKGIDIAEYGQPGSNGLTLDGEGRLTICEHGNRRVTRLEKNGSLTVLADRFEGKRLNSPNDLVYRSDGALFFTDPPFGLPKAHRDPRRESPDTGVYCLANGELKIVSRDMTGPNGLAFSPDEKFLYVGDWDDKHKVLMRYTVADNGTLSNGTTFFDMNAAAGEDALDGLKVDQRGNIYVSGPGGLWIISPDGRRLGTLSGPEHPHNLAWGDDDGKTLYWAAQTGLYRIRLNIPGIRPGSPPIGSVARQ